jgi:hypothetical protein
MTPNVRGGLAGSSLKPSNNSLSKKFINSSDDQFCGVCCREMECWRLACSPYLCSPMYAAGQVDGWFDSLA